VEWPEGFVPPADDVVITALVREENEEDLSDVSDTDSE